jgi:hypothetical protein
MFSRITQSLRQELADSQAISDYCLFFASNEKAGGKSRRPKDQMPVIRF